MGYFASDYNAKVYHKETGETPYLWIIMKCLNAGCVIINIAKVISLIVL
jgi:hypothetical protein